MDPRLVAGLVILLVVFAAGILLAIRFYLFRSVTDVTSHLERLSEDHGKKEEDAKRMLADAEKKSGEMIAKAEEEATEIKRKAEKETQIEREKVIKAARLHSDHIVQQANKTRDFLLAELDENVRKTAIEQACLLMRRVIPENLRRGLHALQVRHMVNGGLGGLSAANFAVVPEEIGISSAYPLGEEDKEKLREELTSRIGRDCKISEETDPGLVAGLVITAGGLVIDGSFRHSIQEAAKDAKHATT